MSYQHLSFDRHGPVAVVTLNRPEKLNALHFDLQDETRAACAEVDADDDLRVMVVTGAGRGFCSGSDQTAGGLAQKRDVPQYERLDEFARLRRQAGGDDVSPQNERLDEFGWVGHQAKAFYDLSKPTIAAVNGVAVGAGMSLALACDMRIGSENARFKTVFIERSLSPDSGMSFFLPRIVGYSRAADLIFTSRFVDASEAHAIGLLDRLVAADALLPAALELANQIAVWPPVAMRSAKRVLQKNLQLNLHDALINETAGLNFANRAPHDVKEARDSFLEKRAPEFTGR